MKALCWHGSNDIRLDSVPEPSLINEHDAIVRITATAICGSDLHLYHGLMPTMEKGDILGHEFMGEIVDVGAACGKKLKIGDKVVVPAIIACGACHYCRAELFSLCETSNPNEKLAKAQLGQAPAAVFGFSHLLGGYAGGQAEYVRVPYADVGPIKIPEGLPDEQVLFLSDIFPTGYMAALNGDIQPGDTVAVWGCGPVGQFTLRSAWMLGAGRVIAIDCLPERLRLARQFGQAETINFKEEDVFDALMAMTNGKGPRVCIDAVGCEAHTGFTFDAISDQIKETVYLNSNRAHALREAIQCCAKGGHVSVPGVYIGYVDNFPFGMLMNKALTVKTGNTHMQRFLQPLLEKILEGDIDPSQIISHRLRLDEAVKGYELFASKQDGCTKVVLVP
ncbi:alcohol dehydrogenase catalytic domain-containing protein [Legionella sp. MW5194]|uniref:zinc-dependent alcohol dehydrogenase n=1 Tax=Legionella sp. MW5194 TaxID=2662448 RepID=UPI00193D9079|nr:zinc-dependent alcohol dehydrogenase [Legionella sp. MW5194]QRN04656.1 alcohol dehydrogenase catalytic domain-containing protein [Legionella sp. MW5194]